MQLAPPPVPPLLLLEACAAPLLLLLEVCPPVLAPVLDGDDEDDEEEPLLAPPVLEVAPWSLFPPPQLAAAREFYQRLGFADTDEMWLAMSPNPADPKLGIHFMHAACPRHHSLALAGMPAPSLCEVSTRVKFALACRLAANR